MKLRIILFILIAILIIFSNIDRSKSFQKKLIPVMQLPMKSTGDSQLHEAVINYLKDEKNKAHFNGVILVANKEDIIYSTTIGYKNYGNEVPITIDEHFRIGSISKQFTGALVMKLIEAGKINPKALVKQYLPELDYPWTNEVTIEHLLRHRSGIVELNEPLAFKPGTRSQYSNVGYQVLQMIVEQVGNASYHQQVAEIAKVCELKNTYVPISKDGEENYKQDPQLAIGYNLFPNDTYNIPERACGRCIMASSGIISSPMDLVKWNNCIWKGKFVSAQSVQQMTGYPKYWRVNNNFYGYGINAIRNKGVLKLYHSGYVYGFLASMAYYPNHGLSIILMENMSLEKEDSKDISKTQDELLEILEDILIKQRAT